MSARGSISRRVLAAVFALTCARCSLLVDTSDLASAGDARDGDRPDTTTDATVDAATDTAMDVADATVVDSNADSGDARAGATVWTAGNGHSYLVVVPGAPLSWTAANGLAAELGGHLVTITSGAENDFVFGLTIATMGAWHDEHGPWIGGRQTSKDAEPDGDWAWVTGEPWSFVAWAAGEPSNYNGIEEFAQFYSLGTPAARWNDNALNDGHVYSYVVEYE